MKPGQVLRALTVCVLVFLLVSCAKQEEPRRGGTLVVGHYSKDLRFTNPLLTTDTFATSIFELLFNGLVEANDRWEVVPDLAESWTFSEDGLTWTFYLKRGVQFHDGVECTSEDVKFTYDLIRDPRVGSPFATRYSVIDQINIIDKYEIEFRLQEPRAPLLASMHRPPILPKHLLDGADLRDSEFNVHPIGTGPFKLQRWEKGKIIFEANERYFKGRPYIEQVIVMACFDRTAAWIKLMRGEIDLMSNLMPEDLKVVQADPTFKVYSSPVSFYYTLLFNLRDPLFSDPRIRWAISYSIDRPHILKTVLQGQGQLSTGPFLPGSWASNPEVKPVPYDPEKALELFAQAGWRDRDGDGFLVKEEKALEFTLLADEGDRRKRNAAAVVQLELGRIGIKVRTQFVNPRAFLEEYLSSGRFQVAFLQFNPVGDPNSASRAWYSKIIGSHNFGFYQNKEVDRLFDLGRRILDQGKRQEIYRRIHTLIFQDQPAAFLFHANWSVAAISQLNVPVLALVGQFYAVEEWYLSDHQRGKK